MTAVSSAVIGESLPAASDVLSQARSIVDPHLSSAVRKLNPGLRAAVEHHLERPDAERENQQGQIAILYRGYKLRYTRIAQRPTNAALAA